MEHARKVSLVLKYDSNDISAYLEPYLLSYSYTDHASATADDLQITLEDRVGLWKGTWLPDKGATIEGFLITQDWEKAGDNRVLPLGTFEVDEIECAGPPETVTIKGVSVPVNSSLRGEDKTRAWEKTNLQVIADDIAKKTGLELFYDTKDNPAYDRIEQTEQSDLSFLLNLCGDAGLSLKITGTKIVIFDDSKYETMEPVVTITKGKSNVLTYNITSSTRDIYKAARVEYKGSKETIKYTYTAPNRPASGKTLVINERVSSIAEAEFLAKKRLRQANKEEVKFTMNLVGDTRLVAGITVMIKGWGKFDGKYIIEIVNHTGPGYTVDIELRRVLEGY